VRSEYRAAGVVLAHCVPSRIADVVLLGGYGEGWWEGVMRVGGGDEGGRG
jgi:hypothetical protein